ncbi:unnamed protein product [Calicophoron daubneyi]
MFSITPQTSHNSQGVPNSGSKLLVTRRSWKNSSTWAKFPLKTAAVIQQPSPRPEFTPLAAWASDETDSGSAPKVVGSVPGDVDILPGRVYSVSTTEEIELDEDTRQSLEEFRRLYGFRQYQLIFVFFSFITYIFDVVSDAYLAYRYHKQGDYYWSKLTLALVVGPSLVITGFSLMWYVLDRKAHVDPPRGCLCWTFRLTFHALQMAPLVRLSDAVYYGMCSKRPGISLDAAVWFIKLMLYEDADCAMLRMIECFMESAPQLLLQLYIIITQGTAQSTLQIIVQSVSCLTSWLSLAWSLTHYQKALRSSRAEKARMRWLSSSLFFLWKAAMLSSRLLSLALLAAIVRGFWFGLALGCHWIVAAGWVLARGTTFCSPSRNTLTEYLFDLVLGAVYCFDVVNIREGHSRIWYSTCYTVFGLENFMIAALWHIFSSNGPVTKTWLMKAPTFSTWVNDIPSWVLPLVVICSFIIGIFVMISYYLFAHPSGRIRVCIPCDELMKNEDPKSKTPESLSLDPKELDLGSA